ncbi:histidine kinase [Streptococcus parauberis]|uniref:histidine kinase n=1 Tax=Streptococcus parauberis TaxID=1348 RepID=UPI003787EF7A
MTDSLLIMITFIVRFGVAWFMFFDMEYSVDSEKNKMPWLTLGLFVVLEMVIIGLVGPWYLLNEPLLMFIYHYMKFPHDKMLHHLFFSQFPVVATDLISKVMLFFVIPFLSNSSMSETVSNYYYLILAYLLVMPVLNFSSKVFSIDDFKFIRFNTRVFNRFVIFTEVTFIIYYILIYSHLNFFQDIHSFKKLIIIIAFFIFLYLLSFLNNYFIQTSKNRIREEEENHLRLLEDYNRYLEKLYKNIRSFRHDYDNIIISLSGSIDSGDFETIQTIYTQILNKVEKIMDDDLSLRLNEFSKVKDFNLRLLLALKVYKARQIGIDTQIDISGSLDVPFLDSADDMVLLSAVSDLAINLVQDTQEAIIKVRYDLTQSEGINLVIETGAEKLFGPEHKEVLDQIEQVRTTFISLLAKYDKLTYRVKQFDRVIVQQVIIEPLEKIGGK